jgi:hypothetical protein
VAARNVHDHDIMRSTIEFQQMHAIQKEDGHTECKMSQMKMWAC